MVVVVVGNGSFGSNGGCVGNGGCSVEYHCGKTASHLLVGFYATVE